jgi:hypothetical protein
VVCGLEPAFDARKPESNTDEPQDLGAGHVPRLRRFGAALFRLLLSLCMAVLSNAVQK